MIFEKWQIITSTMPKPKKTQIFCKPSLWQAIQWSDVSLVNSPSMKGSMMQYLSFGKCFLTNLENPAAAIGKICWLCPWHVPYTLQRTNISHLGKRKIIFKSDFWWDMYDMLVTKRVFLVYFPVECCDQWLSFFPNNGILGFGLRLVSAMWWKLPISVLGIFLEKNTHKLSAQPAKTCL